ncbi:MAG TPA: prolyl oligopeptidase family serine peptidase [Acidimicrobiales bacterium]|nr:prolyl oligopeptidase family serine peptidase [Acidimicrobiales bacterium]
MPATPYGRWPSPVSSAALVEATVGLSQVEVDGSTVYWLESRPLEGGRVVVTSAAGDAIPEGWSARTTVHEYGGGAYTVDRGGVVFANFEDQRLYRVDAPGSPPEPVTPEPPSRWALRYADMRVSPDGNRVACVRETHNGPASTDVVNEIVVLSLDGSMTGEVVATGRDFYAAPRWSPDGSKLAWLSWDHPNMPWDGTDLYVDGVHVAGGSAESIVQPEWSPDGVLHYASDRSGWWNLYRADASAPLVAKDAEFAGPAWVFGLSWYTFLADGRLVCTWSESDGARLGVIDGGTLRVIDGVAETSIGSLKAVGDGVAYIGGSPTKSSAVITNDLAGTVRLVRASRQRDLDPAYISVAEAIEFPTTDGLTAHAYHYAPTNPDAAPPEGDRPPLLVIGHGGPTSATSSVLNVAIQYWTTRGFAVVDVNYGGSTGYGRAYRERLNGAWGVVDVDDCINAARYLADRGDADGARFLIRGGSAGGYTTLCALVFHDEFASGASYYGVADAEALARDTHKFESRYLDGLIGPYPAARERYVERSPIHFADRVSCPVILFQGLEDAVVPPSQAEVFVAALEAKNLPYSYVEYEGEQHGFRRAETIRDAIDTELDFYLAVLEGRPPAFKRRHVAAENHR